MRNSPDVQPFAAPRATQSEATAYSSMATAHRAWYERRRRANCCSSDIANTSARSGASEGNSHMARGSIPAPLEGPRSAGRENALLASPSEHATDPRPEDRMLDRQPVLASAPGRLPVARGDRLLRRGGDGDEGPGHAGRRTAARARG